MSEEKPKGWNKNWVSVDSSETHVWVGFGCEPGNSMEAEFALEFADAIRQRAEHVLRQKARRASEAAQAKTKQENARHQ